MHNMREALCIHSLVFFLVLLMIYSNDLVSVNFPDSDLGEWISVNLPFLVGTPGFNLFHTYLFPVFTAEENVRIVIVHECVQFPNLTYFDGMPNKKTSEPLDNKTKPELVVETTKSPSVFLKDGIDESNHEDDREFHGYCKNLHITELEYDTAAHDYGTYQDALKGARESQIYLLVLVIPISVASILIRHLCLWSVYTQTMADDILLRTRQETWIYEEELSWEMIKEMIEVVAKLKVMRDIQNRSMQKRIDRHEADKNLRYLEFQARHLWFQAVDSIKAMSDDRSFYYRVVITCVIYFWVWISVFAIMLCNFMIKVWV
jgi:hypothetical protein